MKSMKSALAGACAMILMHGALAVPLTPESTIGLPLQDEILTVSSIVGQNGFFQTPPPDAEDAVGAQFQGSLISQVHLNDPTNPLGGLTFSYQLSNDEASTDVLYLMEILGFAGFGVDVAYIDVPDDITSSVSAQRNRSGDRIRFLFGSGDLLFGKDSEQLVLHTDATNYTLRDMTVHGLLSGQTVNVSSYAPSLVPEPTSLALFTLGGLLLARRRRG